MAKERERSWKIMFDYVDFQHREGSIKDRELKLFALSTCGFCKKAMAFLEENNLDYEYVFVDLIDSEVKNKIKADFEKRFEKKMLFPTLIVDDEEFLGGFIKVYWQKLAAEWQKKLYRKLKTLYAPWRSTKDGY